MCVLSLCVQAMATIHSLSTGPTPAEPPPCAALFSAEADGLHYCWRGAGHRSNSLLVYKCSIEQWSFSPPLELHTLDWVVVALFVWVVVCTPLVVGMGLLASITYASLISIPSSGARFKPQVLTLLGSGPVDLSEWTRELCAALGDTVLAPRNQDQHSPGKLWSLMEVGGQMKFIFLMCKIVRSFSRLIANIPYSGYFHVFHKFWLFVKMSIHLCVIMYTHFQVAGQSLSSEGRYLLPVPTSHSPRWTSTGQSCLEDG